MPGEDDTAFAAGTAPYGDELISSWQARVAARYSRQSADIEAWLGLDSSTDNDFDPDPTSVWRWSRACRIRPAVVEALALSRNAASLGYVRQSRWRGICPACLEGDRRNGRDQYLRRHWSRAETVACSIHRVRLRFSCLKCLRRCDFRYEYRDGLAELICSGCMRAVSRAPPSHFELRYAGLLIATMEAIDDAEKGRGETKLADIRKAIRFLWSGSVNHGRPEITFFGVQDIKGPASIPVNVDAPLTCLSMTWRSSTLLTMAQMLDISSAQSEFGPPSDCLTFAFQQFEKNITSSQSLTTRSSTGKKAESIFRLDPTVNILELSPRLRRIRGGTPFRRLGDANAQSRSRD